MRKRGRILALLEAGFLVMGAGAAYGAQAGPGDGLNPHGRRENRAGGSARRDEKETERAEETAGESALPAVPEGLPDGDVLSDPAHCRGHGQDHSGPGTGRVCRPDRLLPGGGRRVGAGV